MKRTIVHQLIPYVIIFLITWLVFNIELASIVLSLVLVYLVFSDWLKPYVFDSKVTLVLLTPFFYFMILQCIALAGWLFNRNWPLNASALTSFIFLALYFLYTHSFGARYKDQVPHTKRAHFRRSDFYALLIASIVTLTIILIPLFVGGFANRSSFVSLVTGNVDDGAHLALFNDRLQFNRGIIYHTNIANLVRSPGAYPLGWYSANAVVTKALYPTIQAGSGQSLGAYIVTKVFWFFILVFVFVKAVFIFTKILGDKKRLSPPGLTWAIASSLFFSVIFLSDFFLYGFYSLFPQLIATLLLAMTMFQVDNYRKDAHALFLALPLITILAISGSLTWLLILPPVLLVILILLLQRLRYVGLSSFKTELKNNILLNFPIYILLGIALLIQYHTYTSASGSVSFMQGILMTGGAPIYSSLLYIFAIVGLALGVSFLNKKAVSSINSLSILFGSILILASIVYFIQISKIGTTAYYYYKIMSVAMIIILPIAITGYLLGIEKLVKKIGLNLKQQVVLVPTVLVFVMLIIPQLLDAQSFRYWVGDRVVSSKLNESIYQHIRAISSTKDYWNKHYTLYYLPNEQLQSAIGTMMLKASKPSSSCFDVANFSVNIRMTLPFDTDSIRMDCAGKYHITIITDITEAGIINGEVQSAGLERTVKVVASEGL